MNKRVIKMNLRKKWVIFITIIITLLACALSFFFIRQLKMGEREHLVRYGFTLANNLAYNSEYGALIANEEILLQLIQGVMREKDVVYCIIQAVSGYVLSSRGIERMQLVLQGVLNENALQTQKTIDQFYISHEGTGIYEIAAPILTKAVEGSAGELEFFVAPEGLSEERSSKLSNIGVARVGISTASANRRMEKAQRTAIITTFIIILIGICVTYFLVGAIVTPIHRLAEGTKIVAKGDLNHRVSISTRDEIGDLGNAFNKMTAELKMAQFQIIQAEKMETVGKLASGIAHEVKNPLAIILQSVEYLVKNLSSDDKNVSLTLGYIKSAVKRADNVVRGLLDFSGSARLDINSCNLNTVIERALLLMKHQFDKYHIRVAEQLKEDLPSIEVDDNRIEQVLVNLFLNAVIAMPDGGKLTVKSYCETDGKENVVIVKIEDTGAGIPDEIFGKIFEPFFTTRRSHGGTGLGLSVVKNIIDLHNGKISIQNRKDGGAEVTLIFKAGNKGGR